MSNNELLREVEAALKNLSMSASQFGYDALKDRRFVFQLREGRDVRMSTVQKVRDFIAKQAVQ